MKCQGTASSDAQGTGYLIVYGIKGSQNDVDSAVYDAVYIVENSKMVMQTGLDMNNNSIENLKQPTNSNHAVNKQYVDTNFLNTNAGLTGNLSMNNHKITNLGHPTSNNDAVNKQFIINSSTIIYL